MGLVGIKYLLGVHKLLHLSSVTESDDGNTLDGLDGNGQNTIPHKSVLFVYFVYIYTW